MTKSTERLFAYVFGVAFIVVMLILAVAIRDPSAFQYTVFRIVLAAAIAGVASMIPGFLEINLGKGLRAGGALAVFVIVYFYSPAGLVKSQQEVELDEPLVRLHPASGTASRQFRFVSIAQASTPPEKVAVLTVTSADTFTKPGVLEKRYDKVIIQNVHARVPPGAALVANDIEGIGAAALIGTDFSIVARRMSNLTVDATGKTAGTLIAYVKQVANSKLLARGAPGERGKDGEAGKNGNDGPAGRGGKCKGFGGWRKAEPGGDGENAGNGKDGEPGGNGQRGGTILLTTIVNPIATTIDVEGGPPGRGGIGGEAGVPGRGGPGGAGCTGPGGSQSSRASGKNGLPGKHGRDGKDGDPSPPGEYRLHLVKSFEDIAKLLEAHSNDELHAQLAKL